MNKPNQKNTTKKNDKPALAKGTIAPAPSVEKKSDAPAKTYATFGALLAAKSKKTLPRGIKAQVGVDRIVFAAKGVCIANLPITDFVTNELKRHAFSVGNVT